MGIVYPFIMFSHVLLAAGWVKSWRICRTYMCWYSAVLCYKYISGNRCEWQWMEGMIGWMNVVYFYMLCLSFMEHQHKKMDFRVMENAYWILIFWLFMKRKKKDMRKYKIKLIDLFVCWKYFPNRTRHIVHFTLHYNFLFAMCLRSYTYPCSCCCFAGELVLPG